MNRQVKRIMKKHLGENFPIDKAMTLCAYYSKLNLSLEDFLIYELKNAIESDYELHRDVIEKTISEEIVNL